MKARPIYISSIPEFIQAWGAVGIVIGGFLFEDVTLALSVAAVAANTLDAPTAIAANIIGIIGGNWALYGAGRWCRTGADTASEEALSQSLASRLWRLLPSRVSAALVRMALAVPGDGMSVAILLSRFAPGARCATGIAAGFARFSQRRYVALIAVSVVPWVLLAFALGVEAMQALAAHPLIAIGIAVGGAVIVPLALKRLRKQNQSAH